MLLLIICRSTTVLSTAGPWRALDKLLDETDNYCDALVQFCLAQFARYQMINNNTNGKFFIFLHKTNSRPLNSAGTPAEFNGREFVLCRKMKNLPFVLLLIIW